MTRTGVNILLIGLLLAGLGGALYLLVPFLSIDIESQAAYCLLHGHR